MEAYFDNSATTAPCIEAIRAVNEALTDCWGNPSSLHRTGNKAKELLAYELTKLVHGEEEANKADTAAKAVFSGGNSADMPTTTLSGEDIPEGGIGILTLLVKCGLAASNGEGRRLVQQGGISVNDAKITDPQTMLQPEGELIIRKGKKVFHKVVMEG